MPGESIQKAFSASTSEAIRGMINRTIIVDWGTIKEVYGDGSVVEVLLSVTDRPENTTVLTCVLVSPCAKGLAINVKPSVGDKVLVLSPRRYDSDMFEVSSDTEVIINEELSGYNRVSCLAILCNQYNESYHKNYITVEEGNISAKLNKVELETASNGDITVKNGKATVNIDNSGNITIDAQGKYTIKNTSTDLKQVIDELAKAVEQLTTTGSQSAQSASPATQAQVAFWRTSQLNSLFSTPTPVVP